MSSPASNEISFQDFVNDLRAASKSEGDTELRALETKWANYQPDFWHGTAVSILLSTCQAASSLLLGASHSASQTQTDLLSLQNEGVEYLSGPLMEIKMAEDKVADGASAANAESQ